MIDAPKFTLIMPAYNEESYIRQAMSSVLRQSCDDFELIAIDDGSTDATGQIMAEFAALDQRIRVISPGKVGKVTAFNMAASSARGDWIYFMGADDYLPEDGLECWNKLVREKSAQDLVAGRGRLRMVSESRKYDSLILPKNLRAPNFSGPLTLQSRAMLDLVLPVPETLPNEDSWWSLCIRFFATDILFMSDVVVNYRVHSGNSIARSSRYEEFSEKYHNRQLAVELFLARFSEHLSTAQIEELRTNLRLETLRSQSATAQILITRGVSMRERFRALAFSSPAMYRLKVALDRWMLGH